MYWQNIDKTFLGGLEDEANGCDVRLRKLKLNLAASFIKELIIKNVSLPLASKVWRVSSD